MPDEGELKKIREHLDRILKHDPECLGVGNELGEVHFRTAQPVFRKINKLAKDLKALPLDLLPSSLVNWGGMEQNADNLRATLDSIAAFSLVKDSVQDRDRLINSCNEHLDKFVGYWFTYIPFLSIQNLEALELVHKFAKLEEDCATVLDSTKRKSDEVDSIVQSSKDAAAKIGVAKFATSFETLAVTHSESAGKWLICTSVFGLATIGLAAFFAWKGPAWPAEDLSPDASLLPFALSKVAVVSLAYITTVWAARNYRAHCHLSVVDSHRQNALSTFEVFVGAATNESTRDAVLLEATRCIFGPSVSGYLTKEQNLSSNRIIEVIKTIGSSG